jgi:hypothetical protein
LIFTPKDTITGSKRPQPDTPNAFEDDDLEIKEEEDDEL